MVQDLTKGNERKTMILFSIPMIIGNMLQQLYNVADTLIVGKYLGRNALAAVGSSYTLMVLITSIVLGLCMGSGVVFAQLYGAKEHEDFKTSIWNSFIFTLIITVVINIIVFLFLENILKIINIPSEAFLLTKEYLEVILCGMIFTFLYNFFASILRSIGNSLVPLIFLAISSALNIILDIVFILSMNMGVKGAALATVLSQILSALLIGIYFFKKSYFLLPKKQNRVYSRCLLNGIVNNSILTSIQQSIMNLGILMIQGLVNSFGVATMAAFAAVVKIDAFAYMPVQDFGNAFSTYIAQNYGAKEEGRIKTGCKEASKISIIFCIVVSILVCVFSKELMLLFVNAEEIEVINIGIKYLSIEGMCYVGIGCLFLLYGFYRGIGRAEISIVLTVVSLGTRVILSYVLAPIESIGLIGIWWSIPVGWILADIIGVTYFAYKKRKLLDFEV